MAAADHLPLAEVKNRRSEVVDRYGPLAGDPSRVGRPLRLELKGRHSAHRGDYRVVCRIDHPRHRVYVLAIGHRADIYRRP